MVYETIPNPLASFGVLAWHEPVRWRSTSCLNASRVTVLVAALSVFGCAAGGSRATSAGGSGTANATPTSSSTVCPDGDCSRVTVADECDGGTAVTVGTGDMTTVKLMLTKPKSNCEKAVDWSAADAAVDKPPPPLTENYACPAGTTRVHVRDFWSKTANPTLGQLEQRPNAVIFIDTTNAWLKYSARQDSANCDWYSTCMSLAKTGTLAMAAQAAACQTPSANSGTFTLAAYASSADVWLDYTGSSSTIAADYGYYPNPLATGAGHFRITTARSEVESELCPEGTPPQANAPAGTIRLHFRYMWGDPAKTGFAGTACEEQSLSIATPPYPTSLSVSITGCSDATAMLELQNGDCPWYVIDIPEALWTSGATLKVTYPGKDASSLSGVALPSPPEAKEYWLAYAGPPQNLSTAEGQACSGRYNPATLTYFYTENPGPGYQGCGGGEVTRDPCNPAVPNGFSPVHFRYLWAGQKTFTYFPRPEFMPSWMVMRIDGNEIICFREADRPWFNCPVRNALFRPGATWIAADTTRAPTEWNTVEAHPLPSTPGEYWIRWTYGKPDFNDAQAPWEKEEKFTVYTYYPDGIGGDLSATGNWGDEVCAPKPPSQTGMKLGFDGWFPYDETNYTYPFGASLALTYPAPGIVQQLFNFIVQERYLLWKSHYLETQDRVCGPDTARVAWRDSNSNTVSEGQGYGMAISAAIGDRDTFDKLWNFTRHFLSQSSQKYCGGLMGWMWDGSIACRPRDSACDIDTEPCGGNGDSAFDGDVDIAIGLVYAAMQWPQYRQGAIDWLLKMECEVNTAYDGKWYYPSNGDTANKDCSGYPGSACSYAPGSIGPVLVNYYPPGYFRVFGDFLQQYLDPAQTSDAERQGHRDFWYKAASSVYEMYERCYDQSGVHPALTSDSGNYDAPCASHIDNYNWARYLWRVGVDAAWFGNRRDFVENVPGSSRHYPSKSEMQAKIDLIQDFFANFYKKNPVAENANRFSSICQTLMPDGAVTGCDPGMGHNSYFVNTATSAYVSIFDNDGKTTGEIRREAIEEAISTTIQNTRYYQESIGVYTLLFLTGNFPNPLTVP
jgi:hypothetical protein